MTTPQQPSLEDTLQALFHQQESHFTKPQLNALRDRIDQVVNYHAAVGVLGKTGAGKSSLCNALFGRDVAEVSDVQACTRHPQEIDLAIKHGKGISLIDVPGVGESEQRDEEYAALYRRLLPELDLVLWVIKADDRALSVDEHVYKSVVQPLAEQHGLPVVFVVNQIDKIEPTKEWDWRRNQPSSTQARNIEAKLDAIQQQFQAPAYLACAVSAEERYGLTALVELIVRRLPQEKKWSFTREARQENVSEAARRESEQGLWDTIKQAASELLCEAWEKVSSAISSAVGRLFGWP